MLEEASLTDYLVAPVGKYVAHANYIHATDHSGAAATMAWGHPEVRGIDDFIKVVDVELSPAMPPHVALVDLSQLDSLDPAIFEHATRYLARVQEASRGKVLRRAMVFGEGMLGSAAAGIYTMVGNDIPYKAFTKPHEAGEWLGVGPSVVSKWLALRDHHMQLGDVATELRAWLVNHGTASAEVVAEALGLSVRNLQRRLKASGSSFQAEVDRYRLGVAREQLKHASHKVEAIAIDLGFKSAAHFSGWFKRHTGLSPATFRSHVRAK